MATKTLTIQVDPFYFGPLPELIDEGIRTPHHIPIPDNITDFSAWMNNTLRDIVGYIHPSQHPHPDTFTGTKGEFWGEHPRSKTEKEKEEGAIQVLVRWLWSID